MSIGSGLLGINAELCCWAVSKLFSAEWWWACILSMSFLLEIYILPAIDVSFPALTQQARFYLICQQPSTSAVFYIHWFWVILTLHLWLLKTQWRPLGSWSLLWVLKLLQPMCAQPWSCCSPHWEMTHYVNAGESLQHRNSVESPQHICCDLRTFASRQSSYS